MSKENTQDTGRKFKGLFYLFLGFVGMIGIVLLLVIAELFRGEKSWQTYSSEAKARGSKLGYESFIPAPVEDSNNFACTPALAPLFDFLPGTQQWRDTNANRLMDSMDATMLKMANQLGLEPQKEWGSYTKAQRHDLTRFFRRINDKRETHPSATAHNLSPEMMKRYGLVSSNLVSSNNIVADNSDSQPLKQITNETEAAHIMLELYQEAYGPFLEELHQAKHRPYCRFNIKYDHVPVSDVVLPHLALMKNTTQKLMAKAIAHLTLDQSTEAFNDVALSLYLSDCIKGEPWLISSLVRLSMRHMVYGTIWEGIARHRWTDDQLRQLLAGLKNDNLLEDMKWTLQAERAFGLYTIKQLSKQSSKAGISFFGDNGPVGNSAWAFIPKGWYYQEMVSYAKASEALYAPFSEWIDGRQTTAQFYQATKAQEDSLAPGNFIEALWNHRLFTGLLLPATSKASERAQHSQVRHDQVRIACALERFFLANGDYPKDLASIDPQYLEKIPLDRMSGQPFKYKADEAKGYILYSIGKNLEDDQGKIVTQKGRKNADLNLSEGDWVWLISSANKERK